MSRGTGIYREATGSDRRMTPDADTGRVNIVTDFPEAEL